MTHTTLALLTAGLLTTGLATTASAAPAPDGVYYIKAQHSGKCVHQHGNTTANGGNVTQWDCIDQDNVKVEKVSMGSGYFLLKFKHSGKCLTVEGDSGANDANIVQQDCIESAPRNQTWMEIPGQGKYVKIQSSIGHCLHQHGATMGNGDNITAWECVDQPNVRWEFVPVSDKIKPETSSAPTIPPTTIKIDQACNTYADSAVADNNANIFPD